VARTVIHHKSIAESRKHLSAIPLGSTALLKERQRGCHFLTLAHCRRPRKLIETPGDYCAAPFILPDKAITLLLPSMIKAGIFNDTSVSGHYGCTAVIGTLIAALAERNTEAAYLWPVATDWQGHTAYLEAHRSNMIVVNGEGTIHHSAERKRTRDLCAIARYASDRQIPVHLVNASISDLEMTTIEAISLFDTIHVRETASQDYLNEYGIAATVVPDLSLGWPVAAANISRKGVIVTDSVLKQTAGELRSFAEAMKAQYESMRPRPSTAQRLKNSLAKRIKPSPAATHWHARSNVDGFIRRLKGCDLIVTGRFHSVMLAILTDTPFVTLQSNTGKIEAVLKDCFGDTSRMITTAQLKDPAFMSQVATGLPFKEQESAALAHYRETARVDRSAMFDRIVGKQAS
jgi:polysaccharide pyruvyl transferase WcaK-like protein